MAEVPRRHKQGLIPCAWGRRCPFALALMLYFSSFMNTNEVQNVNDESGAAVYPSAPFEPLYFMLGVITALLLLNLLKGRYFI